MKIVYIMLCLFVLAVDCANKTQCQLPSHRSVEYRCFFSDPVIFDGTSAGAFRACREFEPTGTVVSPQCRTPDYFSTSALAHMRCKSGKWDYIAKCIPECGIVTPDQTQLVLGGESAKQAEVPWHAGIYTKTSVPYKQLCGGTLINNKIVISAAHCFWDNQQSKLLLSDSFAVAIGKLYRPWDNKMDKAQHSDVKEVHIPEHFQGSSSYFQADIALVVVTTPFEFNPFVRPVCIDFDNSFEKIQLQPGNKGKVAGWGLTTENGTESQVLKVIELPYISTGKCISDSPYSFRPYITTDKFCAGYKNAGKALCKGDSGGGLAFPESGRGKERHYLRGVVSAAPNEDLNKCNANAYTSFTKLQIHEHFIKEFWVAEDQSVSDTRPVIEGDDRNTRHTGRCILPPYPDHGTYVVVNVPNAKPGDTLDTVYFNMICDKGYRVSGSSSGFCFNGTWPGQLPKCVVLPCTDASLNSSIYYFTPTYSMDDVSLNHYVTLNRNSIGHLLHFEMHFAVQTDGYMVLKLSEEESYLNSNSRYKLFIGWDSHQRYRLYYNGKTVRYIFNQDILSSTEFRQFYIKIGNGTLQFGKEGDSTPIISYPSNDLGSLTYYRIEVYDSQSAKLRYCPAAVEGSSCKEGSFSASHLVYTPYYGLDQVSPNHHVVLKGDDGHYAYFKIHFAVRMKGYVTITLSEKANYDHSNIRCALRVGVDGNRRTRLDFNGATVHYIDTPDIFSPTQFRNFYIKMDDGTLQFGKDGDSPLISYSDTRFSAVLYYRFELYSRSSELRFCPVAVEGSS